MKQINLNSVPQNGAIAQATEKAAPVKSAPPAPAPLVEQSKMVADNVTAPTENNQNMPQSIPNLYKPRLFSRAWHQETVDGKSRWLHLVGPYATAFTGLAGLASLISAVAFIVVNTRAYNQSVTQFTQQQTAQQERDKRARIDEQTKEARSHQFDDFNKVQERLGNDDPKVRAAAVLQLADLAVQPLPTEETIKGAQPIFGKAAYPYFARTSTQLALILPNEEDAAVRTAIVKSVQSMVDFVKSQRQSNGISTTAAPQKEESYEAMLREFADANRQSKADFVGRLAEYGLVNDLNKPATTKLLATMTKFTDKPKANVACLRNLTNTDAYAAQKLIHQAQREVAQRAHSPLKTQGDAVLLDKVEQSASQLRDTRDAVVSCLNAATNTTSVGNTQHRVNGAGELNDCFLAGADITSEANPLNIKQFYCTRISLEGAVFLAKLDSASFTDCGMDYATIRTNSEISWFTRCSLKEAQFNYSRLNNTQFSSCHMEGATFYDSTLNKATFRDVRAEYCDFADADFAAVTFRNTHLDGADFSETGVSNRHKIRSKLEAYFEATNLDKAWVIPALWETAVYSDAKGHIDASLRKRVGDAYTKQNQDDKFRREHHWTPDTR